MAFIYQGHKDRNGSEYNVEVEWQTGSIITEPLDLIASDPAVDLAIYGG